MYARHTCYALLSILAMIYIHVVIVVFIYFVLVSSKLTIACHITRGALDGCDRYTSFFLPSSGEGHALYLGVLMISGAVSHLAATPLSLTALIQR